MSTQPNQTKSLKALKIANPSEAIAPVLDQAGSGAWADMWRVAPPLAAIALILKALRIRPQ